MRGQLQATGAMQRRMMAPRSPSFSCSWWPRLAVRRPSRVHTRAAAAADAASEDPSSRGHSEQWPKVVAVTAGAMLLCNLHRSTFSALLPELAAAARLRPGQIGEIQASMLAAYLVGQLPAGALADRLGGARVLLSGLALWSAATAATALAAGGGGGALTALHGSRALLGLSSACAMPCVTAAVAEWAPRERRAGAVAAVYALFNTGGVAGLVLAPLLAQAWGLAAAFVLSGLAGVAWAAGGGAFLSASGCLLPTRGGGAPAGGGGGGGEKADAGAGADAGGAAGAGADLLPASSGDAREQLQQRRRASEEVPAGPGGAGAKAAEAAPLLASSSSSSAAAAAAGAGGAEPAAAFMGMRLARGGLRQVAVLCAAHATIGYGFFLMQNWIPVYLSSLGRQQLSATGGMAALPWLAAAAAGVASGGAADRLIRAGVPALRVRRLFQCASFLGCAASALPLALAGAPGLGLAVACLTANLAFYSASFGGFHAHLQDVAGPSAGVLQGLTNSCSIAMGMAGNLATGWLVEATGSYSSVFWFLAALYTAAAAMWATCTTGDPLEVPRAAPS